MKKELRKFYELHGNWTLHLMHWEENLPTPYVVCWNWNGESWDWGKYFVNLKDANDCIEQQAIEYGYREVTPK